MSIDGQVISSGRMVCELSYFFPININSSYDSLCHGYYIIEFSSSTYTLQADLSIDGKVISSGEMVCEGTYFFPMSISSYYYVLQRTKSIITIFSLRKIINENVNVICYDHKDVLQFCLSSIPQNDYNIFSPLLHHNPT